MARRFDLAQRLEPISAPGSPDIARRALRADVSDPVWFLGRQWLLGEHDGADAAWPVEVAVATSETPITSAGDGPEHDPRITPPEVMIEAEAEQWWTPGRRVRVGQALAGSVPPEHRDDPALQLAGLAAPHDRLNGRGLDGLALYRARAELGLGLEAFAAVGVAPDASGDSWQPATLTYQAGFTAGPVALEVPRHDGGDVDWYSVAATGGPLPAGEVQTRTSHPTRVTYPGSPLPRWWQITDHRTDPGAVAFHRTYLAALLMLHVSSSHGDDWFTAPFVATSGSVVDVAEVRVRDSMDQTSVLTPVAGWSLFLVSGLGPASLVTWPTVLGRLNAPASLDEVVLGVDDDANVLWAVEQRVDGADVGPADSVADTEPVPADVALPTGQVVVTAPPSYGYLPSTTVPPYWHPYLLSTDGPRRFLQARLADLLTRPVTLFPGPASRMLRPPRANDAEPYHALDPAAVPKRGLRIDRRYQLGRRTDGLPVLWVQRRTTPLQGPPVSGLLFDVLEPRPVVAGETTGGS